MPVTPQFYELFRVQDDQNPDPGTIGGQGAPRLYPQTHMGLIDVVEDFAWTLSPREARIETPRIQLVEYQLKSSALLAAFNRWKFAIGNAKDAAGNALGQAGQENSHLPYYGLYPAKQTGFWYSLPYFSDIYRTITNSWDSADALSQIPIANKIPIIGEYMGLGGIEALAKAWAVGVGHEIPLAYSGTNRESLNVMFVLLNTVSIHDIQRNWEFIYLMSYQNSQNRRNYIVVDPPKFYTVQIEGVKYSSAMYVSDFQVGNLGQTKRVFLNGALQHIPEAWAVKITLTDLIPHSQNMLEAMRARDFSTIEATQGNTSEWIAEHIKDIGNPDSTGDQPPNPPGSPPPFNP